jgi:ABC-type transport system involved in multi-copper enzyme maturation permease subunit
MMAASPVNRRPSFASSALRIFDLSLGEMLWSRRSVFLGLLVGGPVLLAVVSRVVWMFVPNESLRINGGAVSGASIFGLMIWLLYVRFIVPILGVFYGTSLIADEVEDRTITYLFTRPIQRGAVLVGKYVAYLACTVLLILPSVMVVFFLMVPVGGGSIAQMFPSLLADLGMLATGLAAYGAVFAWVGARVKRPLVAGLVFVLGWEPAVLLFPGYLKRATVAYYLQALVPHAMPQDSTMSLLMQAFSDMPGILASLIALVVLTVGALWFAARTVESREYVLEQ